MALSLSEITTIYEQSSNLAERLGGLFEPAEDRRAQGAATFASWQQVIAGYSDGDFSQIVEAMAGDPGPIGEVQRLLGPVTYSAAHPLPPWTGCLADISETISTAFSSSHASPVRSEEIDTQNSRLPFWHLFQPVADMARARVADAVPRTQELFGPKAWNELQHQLLRRISAVVSSALHTRFLVHKALVNPGISALFQELEGSEGRPSRDSRRFYERFVREEGQSGLRQFFFSYPVAARLISEVTLNWIAATAELARRFEADEHCLMKVLHPIGKLGKIMQVKSGLSDPHRGGRTVMILGFECGGWLVYKPRPMQVDVLFSGLLCELNRQWPGIDFLLLKSVAREGYGWQQFVEPSACGSMKGAKRFYRRAGALVALVHWLQGIDFHRENIVAAGEQPVLIDLETLGHPPRPGSESLASNGGHFPFEDSLMRIGLLPLRQSRFEEGALYDNSGLGAPVMQNSLVEVLHWKEVNSDQMNCVHAKRRRSLRSHRPHLHRRVLSLQDYTEEVWQGFRFMAAILNDDKTGCLAARREAIYLTPRRWIRRPTLIYAMLIRRSLQPEQLTNGLKRSIGLQALPCEAGTTQAWIEEIADLERLDIPYFDLQGQDTASPAPSRPSFDERCMRDHQRIIIQAMRRRLVLKEGWLHEVCRQP